MPDHTPAPAPLDDGSVERSRLIWLLRAIFLVLLVIFSAILIVSDSSTQGGGLRLVTWWPLAVLGTLLFFGGVVAVDSLTPKRKLSTVSAVIVGLIGGVLITFILGLVLDLFAEVYGLGGTKLLSPIKVMIGLGICYLTITTVLQTQNDFRLVIPYVEFAKQRRGVRPLVLDSSALIDARIVEVAEIGLLQAPILVPGFVVEELQRLADSSDRTKRARGRRGLDTVTRLQRSTKLDVKLDDTIIPEAPVDQMVIELARLLPGVVVTTDTGLIRVAAIQTVSAINLHDLAAAVRPTVIAGDRLTVRIIRRGEHAGQGVGYLDDGTMVVADHAEHLVGEDAGLIVTGTVQTSAGRLIFAKLDDGAEPSPTRAGDADVDGAHSDGADHDQDDPAAPRDSADGSQSGPPRGPLPSRRSLRNPRRG